MMPFSQAIRTCLRRYADFRGRATRAEFWWWWWFGCGLTVGLMNLLQAALIASVAFEWWPEDWGFGPWALLAFCRRATRKDRQLRHNPTLSCRYIPPSPRHRQERLVATPMVAPRLTRVGAGSDPISILWTLRSHGTGGQLQSRCCPLGAPYPNPRVRRPGCCWRGYVHPGSYLAIPPRTTCIQPLRQRPALIISGGQRLRLDPLQHRAVPFFVALRIARQPAALGRVCIRVLPASSGLCKTTSLGRFNFAHFRFRAGSSWLGNLGLGGGMLGLGVPGWLTCRSEGWPSHVDGTQRWAHMKPRHKLPRADKDVQVIETPSLEPDYIFDIEQGQFIPRWPRSPGLGPVLRDLARPAIKVVLVAVVALLGLLMVQASMPILDEPNT